MKVMRAGNKSGTLTAALPEPFVRGQIRAGRGAYALVSSSVLALVDSFGDVSVADLRSPGIRAGTVPADSRFGMSETGDARATLWVRERSRGDAIQSDLRGVDKRRDLWGLDCRMSSRTADVLEVAQDQGIRVLQAGLLRVRLTGGMRVLAATVSPDGSLLALTVSRRGGSVSRIFDIVRGAMVGELPIKNGVVAAWVDNTRVLITAWEWPNSALVEFDVLTGSSRTQLVVHHRTVDDVTIAENSIAFTLTGAAEPRQLVSGTYNELREDSAKASTPDGVLHTRVGPRKLPVIVMEPTMELRGTVYLFHGGPGGRWEPKYSPLSESLREMGFQVVMPNLSSSSLPETSAQWSKSSRLGESDVEDAIAVIKATARGKKIIVGGQSYGGFVAWQVGRAMENIHGVFCLGGFLSPDNLRRSAHRETRELLATGMFSTVDAGRRLPPLFFAHGGRDTRIPSEDLLEYIHDLGIEMTGLVIDEMGHGVTSDSDAAQIYPEMFSWIRDV
ncbi:alpha/beta fold hydrolase [Microbacterium sp. NPDC058269]|uniref:alpha/beta fold hydrolase n=1 Tax=Microbacterium sp. NPDC058269 TaxID=3346414 RepID=UPI0036D7B3F4